MMTSGIISGSTLGISRSGIPLTSRGRNSSTDFLMHFAKFASDW